MREGSTIKGSTVDAVLPTHQLFLLGCLHSIMAFYLLVFLPFNDKIENIIQGAVTFSQGMFFFSMGQAAIDDPGSNIGPILNDINLAAMTIVIVAGMRAQARPET